MAPPSQRCVRPKAWGAKEAPGATAHLPTAHGGPLTWGSGPGCGTPRESIQRSLQCSLPVLPLDQPQPSKREGGGVPLKRERGGVPLKRERGGGTIKEGEGGGYH